MSKPRVSVVSPMHNKGPYVGQMVESLFQQVMEDWELIVVENSSTDDGPDIVSRIADSRVRMIDHQGTGPGSARNCGLSHASGEWVLFLDADDWIAPAHLESLLSVAGKNHEASIIAGGWCEYSEKNASEKELHKPAGYKESDFHLAEYSIANAPWAVHAAMIKRAVLKSPCVWVEELDIHPSEDTAFWFRLLCHCKVAYCESSNAIYRVDIPGNRNVDDDPEIWFEAMKGVTDSNIRYFEQESRVLSGKHSEYLMRRRSVPAGLQ